MVREIAEDNVKFVGTLSKICEENISEFTTTKSINKLFFIGSIQQFSCLYNIMTSFYREWLLHFFYHTCSGMVEFIVFTID